MKLGKLLHGVVTTDAGIPHIEVDQITPDSRRVKSGTVFVAYQGVAIDGHGFIDQAIRNGAVAVANEVRVVMDEKGGGI